MLVNVKQTNRENEVELVIEKEVRLKQKYRDMSAREIIKNQREKRR